MRIPGCQPTKSSSSSTVPRIAAGAALALGASAGLLWAAQIDDVRVEGAEFIGTDQILAACPVETGRRLSASEIDATEVCLMETGAFSAAEARVENDALVLEVKELNSRPGRLEFGLGYDSADGLYASALFERYNLLPGVFGGMELRIGQDLHRVKSYLFAKEAWGGTDLGLDMGYLRVSGSDYGYTQHRFTFEPYLARDLGNGLRGEFGLGYTRERMSDVVAGASALLRAETGLREAPHLRIGLRQAPSEGTAGIKSSARIDYTLWGLGKSEQISTLTAEAEARLTLDEHYSLGLRVNAGLARGHGDTALRTTERFSLGSGTLRGFAHRGVGPNDGGWQLGGDTYLAASVSLDRKIGDVFGAPATLGVFVDAGSAWGYDGAPALGARDWRSALGASLTVDLGGVPVSAYLAKPLSSRPGDKTQYFGLSIEILR